MSNRSPFDVIFLGGRQAGVIGLLTVLAHGEKVKGVVAYNDYVADMADALHIPKVGNLAGVWNFDCDLIVSVHGDEIVPDDILAQARLGGINVHPCLRDFKGRHVIKRFLASGKFPHASVGVHRMIAQVDRGEVLKEIFVDVSDCKTEVEVYNALYPYYAMALWAALEKL